MSTGYKIVEQDEPYFVTLQIVKWIDIFTRQVYQDIIIDSLTYCRQNKGLEIYAYVIMSNHIHLLIRSKQGCLSNTIKEFKSFTAKELLKTIQTSEESRKDWMLNLFEFAATQHRRNEKHQLWTHENHAEIIYSNSFITQKIQYIHNNPVSAGIVEQPEDYLYSSARNYADMSNLLEIDVLFLDK